MKARILVLPGAALLLCSPIDTLQAAPKAKTYSLNATTDFKDHSGGEAPFYKDVKRRALAINAANRNFRDKWATAKTTFAGEPGLYDMGVSINTVPLPIPIGVWFSQPKGRLIFCSNRSPRDLRCDCWPDSTFKTLFLPVSISISRSQPTLAPSCPARNRL